MSAAISESDLKRLADAYREHAPAGSAARVFALPPPQRDAVLVTVRDNAARAGKPVELFLAQLRPDEPRAVRESAVRPQVPGATPTADGPAEPDFDAMARDFAALAFRGSGGRPIEHADRPAGAVAEGPTHPIVVAPPAGFDPAVARQEFAAHVMKHLDRRSPSALTPEAYRDLLQQGIDDGPPNPQAHLLGGAAGRD